MRQLLYNIKKVERIPVNEISDMEVVLNRMAYVPVYPKFSEEIEIIGMAKAQVKDEIQNNIHIYTTVVEFKTCEPIPESSVRYCYILTSVDGKKRFVGSNVKPFAVLTNSVTLPDKPSSPSCNNVTISYQSSIPLLEMLD